MKKIIFGLIVFGIWAAFMIGLRPTPVQASLEMALPTPSSTSPILPAKLPKVLSIDWIWGNNVQIDGATFKCPQILSAYTSEIPFVIPVAREKNSPFGSLCMIGFPADKPFNILLTDKSGKVIGSYNLQKSDIANYAGFYSIQQIPVGNNSPSLGYMIPTGSTNTDWLAEVVLYLPPDLAGEAWNVEVSSGTLRAKTSLNAAWPTIYPAIYISDKNFNPFDRYWYLMPQDFPVSSIRAGDIVQLRGVNLPRSQTITLALYGPVPGNSSKLEIVRYSQINTDTNGSFSLEYKTLPTDGINRYYLVAVTNPSGKVPGTSYRDGAGPYLGIYLWISYPCLNAPGTYSHLNRTVKLDPRMNFSVYVRQEPGKFAPQLEKFSKETKALIEDGPRCADNMVWWKVSYDKTGVTGPEKVSGWVAEGPGPYSWLVDYGN